MKFKILNIRLGIVYRLAKATNRLSTWFCNKHTELYNEWKREFKETKERLRR